MLSVLALSIIGVLAVGSAEPSSQIKQIIGIIIGIIVMLVISMIDYEWLLNLYWLIYGFNLFLLLYVHFFRNGIKLVQRGGSIYSVLQHCSLLILLKNFYDFVFRKIFDES